MIIDINEWYSEKLKSNVLFSYKGCLTSEKITRFLNEIEKKVLICENHNKIKRKIYNVLVESLQNSYHHGVEMDKNMESLCDSDEFKEASKFCIILFQKKDIGYKLTTANFVKRYKAQLLKDKLDQVNVLSSDEIKALYKLILNNHEFSERGGGGLGLIDIAKRTENKLHYEFHEYSDDLYFYNFEVNVS